MSTTTLSLIALALLALLVAVLPELQRVFVYRFRKPVNASAIYLHVYLPLGIPKSFVDEVLFDIATAFKIHPAKIRPNDNFFWLLTSLQTVFDSRSNEKISQLINRRFPSVLLLDTDLNARRITTVKELICFLWIQEQNTHPNSDKLSD